MTFFLDVPVDVAWRRLRERPGGPSPDESHDMLTRFRGSPHREILAERDASTRIGLKTPKSLLGQSSK